MPTNPAQTRAIYLLTFLALTAAIWAVQAHVAMRLARGQVIPSACLQWRQYIDLPESGRAACEVVLEMREGAE